MSSFHQSAIECQRRRDTSCEGCIHDCRTEQIPGDDATEFCWEGATNVDRAVMYNQEELNSLLECITAMRRQPKHITSRYVPPRVKHTVSTTAYNQALKDVEDLIRGRLTDAQS